MFTPIPAQDLIEGPGDLELRGSTALSASLNRGSVGEFNARLAANRVLDQQLREQRKTTQAIIDNTRAVDELAEQAAERAQVGAASGICVEEVV